MNNLMSRKKKYRFQVDLRVEELQHVPFLCQELYVKVRLVNGTYTNHSQSLMVENHAVRWNETFTFSVKMTASASTGELDSCICRVSVRQEMRGGRSFQKLGYADVNLAQFAGSGGSNIYLLGAYDSKHRLHNSTLKVTVDMTLQSGDPCFKAQPWPNTLQPPIIEGPPEATTAAPHQSQPPSGSVASIPSLGYNSLDKKTKAVEDQEAQMAEQTGHSRNSSNTSGSGYVSNASHSDKSSHASEWDFSVALERQRLLSVGKVKSLFDTHRKKSDPSLLTTSTRGLTSRASFPSIQTLSTKDIMLPSSVPFLPPLIPTTCVQCRKQSITLTQTAFRNSLNLHLSSVLNANITQADNFIIWHHAGDETPSPLDSLSILSSLSRSGSQGSGGTYSEGGSLERSVPAGGRGKGSSIHSENKDPRVVATREDAHDMIDQIFQDNIGTIKSDESAEALGLQLYIREDGTASVTGRGMRPNGDLKPIIINKR